MVLRAKNRQRGKPLKGFYKESRARNCQSSVDRGIRAVGIDKIVGSVGKSLSFNSDFSLRDPGNVPHTLARVARIEEAIKRDILVPPVELYEVDEEYYVLDGHHRIIAAKKQGQKFIDAHVIEYIPMDDNERRKFIEKRIQFEVRTGLSGMRLSHRGGYDRLFRQIENYETCLDEKRRNGLLFRDLARDWHESIYLPVARGVKDIGLKEYLPGATTADIYVYLCNQINLHSPKPGRCGIDLKETLEELTIVAASAKAMFAKERLGERILGIFRPSSYRGRLRHR